MTNTVLGLLAHVDAGKTTLSEQILYNTGAIRTLGRVDNGDTRMDSHSIEKERGITIFSSQAQVNLGDMSVTILDTPGHADFAAETERTLQVLDYAILLLSVNDGVTGHVMTLWHLLEKYDVPVFVFINKMDQTGADKPEVINELRDKFGDAFIDMDDIIPEDCEQIAMCDEYALEEYLENGSISRDTIRNLIIERKLFPCFSGSALKDQGVNELLNGLSDYMKEPEYDSEFGARVFKITRDKGNRLTWLKLTGGSLKVKDIIGADKIDQIRIYNGADYRTCDTVKAGDICAVSGFDSSSVGMCCGTDADVYGWEEAEICPVLNYELILPQGVNVTDAWQQLKCLSEEDPMLKISYESDKNAINIYVMGAVQLEVLKSIIHERFGMDVEFGTGVIVYKETVDAAMEGVGHYEPLRHYAEAHVVVEALPRGSGIEIASICPEDDLDRNWQRLIMTHLGERRFKGPLTGSELTDVRFTLVSGKNHLKHTEGGDFREATYRAVNQALRKLYEVGRVQLLEPVYAFTLQVPEANLGRAINDIQKKGGDFAVEGNVITGHVPVSEFVDYQQEMLNYTHGEGYLTLKTDGYTVCHNSDEVCDKASYDPDLNVREPSGSVFTKHGAGYYVPWYEVDDMAHIDLIGGSKMHFKAGITPSVDEWEWDDSCDDEKYQLLSDPVSDRGVESKTSGSSTYGVLDKELDEIFNRTYGDRGKRTRPGYRKRTGRREHEERINTVRRASGEYRNTRSGSARAGKERKDYLLVDGYNIIHAWEELSELMAADLGAARGRLLDIMSNYQGYRKNEVIVVFDAYKVPGNPGSVEKYHNIHVVYTKEAETADQYIEKTVHAIGKEHNVTVATSDLLEQVIIMGQNGRRMSASDLYDEINNTNADIMENISKMGKRLHNPIL